MSDTDMAQAASSSSSAAAASPSSATGDEHKFRFSIDRGGTFTDVYAELPVHADGSPGGYRVLKLLSEDPASYSDAPREAIRRVLESVTGIAHPIDQPLDTSRIGWIRMGTTVATNALLERKGERTAFLVTKGFKDLLHIGNQSRAKIFDLEIARPENVYERVVEVDERVMVHTNKEGGKEWRDQAWEQQFEHTRGVTGEEVLVLQAPDLVKLEAELREVFSQGIRSLAVSLAHSYTFPRHEQQVGELAKRMGFTHISLSSSLMPMIKLVPRSYTACADAYLTPCIHQYLNQFRRGFDEHMERNTKVWFMQSDGGLVPVDKFSGFRAVLSGPAGGVVGYAQVTPIKPKSERALAQDAQASAAARSSGKIATGSSSLDRSIEDRFNIAQEAVIGFDMGGTSTDVSRYSGRYEHIFENQTAGITIQAPQLDINTVAAGGGSMLFFKNGLFVVGPDSAGAHPGPASYRKGGPLTITDANLFLGRLLPEHFPKIFGPHQDQPLDAVAAASKFEALTAEINAYFARQGKTTVMAPRDVALGFVVVANEAMCRPIRALTQSKGYDIQRHTLSCFGGAGGQHAAAIARNLGLSTIFLHRFSGILSAYGLGLANIVQEVQEPCTKELNASNMPYVIERIEALKTKALAELSKYGFDGAAAGAAAAAGSRVECQVFLNLRYTGTDTSVMTTLHHGSATATASVEDDDDDGDEATGMDVEDEAAAAPAAPTSGRKKSARASASKAKSKKGAAAAASKDESAPYLSVFVSRYQREYGFTLANRAVIIDDIRVRGIGHSLGVQRVPIASRPAGSPPTPAPAKVVKTFFEADSKASSKDAGGRLLDTAVYLLSALHAEDEIKGPAMVIDNTSTTLIEPGCTAKVTLYGDLEIYVGRPEKDSSTSSSTAVVAHRKLGLELDNIQLSIFSHRFMSIAEQMGRTLQRTSISTNIKERLDFSCALFGPDGGLVANAPHLPVHLGSMQEAVKFQLGYLGESWTEGQVIVTNHPQAGGSHLPDITVITPVFSGGRKVFFVASRGHHADIGGISPGSMPPFSKRLYQEGARIVSFALVSRDPLHPDHSLFNEQGITEVLQSPGKVKTGPDEPKCVGTRCLSDNLADLRAQVAANQKGIKLMEELIAQYSLEVVQQYMTYIQANAEEAVREMLRDISVKRGLREVDTLHAEDFLDDGSRIHLSLTIDRTRGSAIFDFTGTSPEVYSNTNAPPAVTYSAIIYCLRCQVKRDIPLNQGCLNPIEIRIPKGCFLNPSSDAAVVGGNVLTSQRVTDVVLRAFEACAASQGCMNNFTFGDETFGYYETIAGGAGGGPTWDGQSGVHTHMTNTRITDPEILERRYPVLLREFSLRAGSGGAGLHPGGCGVIREVEFLRPLDCGILSERRVLRPYGLAGGGQGKSGKNFLIVRERKGAAAREFRNGGAEVEEESKEAEDATMEASKGKKKIGAAGGSKKKKGAASAAAAAAASSSSAAAATPAAEPIEYEYRRVNLGGKNTYKAAAHDRIRIVTPGGGGWGTPIDDATAAAAAPASAASSIAAHKRKLHGGAAGDEDSNKKAHITAASVTQSLTTVQRGAGGSVAVTAVVETVNLRTGGSVAAWQSLQEQA